ncbi:MAG: helix-turn-helix transcriptional regulator [Candidatus Limnocylindrales bacterium]
MDLSNPGNRIRLAREEQCLTRAELGSRCGVSAASIAAVEEGRQQPTLRLVAHLSRELHVPAALLTIDPAVRLEIAVDELIRVLEAIE